MYKQQQCLYAFGPFSLDPVKRRLFRGGEAIPLTPKAFDTLLALVEQSGETVEKEDLMKRIWPDAIVEENNLNQNITALRKSLGDSRQESQYIATIPGLGYRFVAEVKLVPREGAGATRDGTAQSSLRGDNGLERGKDKQIHPAEVMTSPEGAGHARSTEEPRHSSERLESGVVASARSVDHLVQSLKRHSKLVAIMVALIVVATATLPFWIYRIIEPQPTDKAANKWEVTALTRSGTVGAAVISPDGRYIIYSVHEGTRDSLWLRQVAASSAQQIVPPAEVRYFGLTFSPDGNHIVFCRGDSKSGRALYRMPALGGVPVKLLTDLDSTVTFSPDAGRIAFIRNSPEESALMIANADGSNEYKLASRPSTDDFKVPAWSPDGKIIACSFGSGDPYDIQNGIAAIRVEDGTESPLTQKKWGWTRWVEWLSDGTGLLVTARERHDQGEQIWHVSYPGGAAGKLTSDSKLYLSVSAAADCNTMVAVQTELLSDIWVLRDLKAEQAAKVTFGTGSYDAACYTPDGRVVYASQASGNWDMWVMNPDGSNPKQLTADAGVNLHQDVSPDGRYIVFASNRSGVFNIWRIDSDGSNPVQLTRGSGEKFPNCSPDGKWVIYNSVASNQDYGAIWKVPIEGGEPVRLTSGNTPNPVVSPDGKSIAYFYREVLPGERFRIGVIPFSGGQPEKSFDIPEDLDPSPLVHWFPDGQSLTYGASREGRFNIWMQPLNGGEPKQVTNLNIEGRFLFGWSGDGKQLAFSRGLWRSDLVLMKNVAPGNN